jgi:hypothetical protein
MDKRQPKCFHNGIILIVNCFQFCKDTKIIKMENVENRN